MPRIDELLNIVKTADASDLHLVAGCVPMVRVNGQLEKTRHKRLTAENVKYLIYEILTDDQIRRFENSGDMDLSYGLPGVARFRINVYRAFTGISAAVRLIPDQILDLKYLGFGDHIQELVERKSGLVLVTGPTSSGKSTTLAAMVDHINTCFARHIITLEDPIEYIHENKNSLVSQRQIGLHAESFGAALRSAVREDPSVLLVGEMRDTETIQLAVTAAEVGLLVLGTLHTATAAGTVDRIVDVFPPQQQQQIRVMLADSLVGVVSQQLLRRADDSGRVVAYELMVSTASIKTLVREGRSHQIPSVIQTGRKDGMRLIDNHLKALLDAGRITFEEAVRAATQPQSFCRSTADLKREEAEA
ncbi:MAG: type IV pilus twitching motility protein PilT [bacterium]